MSFTIPIPVVQQRWPRLCSPSDFQASLQGAHEVLGHIELALAADLSERREDLAVKSWCYLVHPPRRLFPEQETMSVAQFLARFRACAPRQTRRYMQRVLA